MKKTSLRRAKANAWKWFSLYIRTRDCIKTERSMEYGKCVTCSRTYPLKSLQAGHFIAGRHNSVLFDEIGVNAQCYGCNVGKNGAPQDYWLWMEKEYGRDIIDELLQKRHQTVKYTVQDYEEIAQTYRDKLSGLTLN